MPMTRVMSPLAGNPIALAISAFTAAFTAALAGRRA